MVQNHKIPYAAMASKAPVNLCLRTSSRTDLCFKADVT